MKRKQGLHSSIKYFTTNSSLRSCYKGQHSEEKQVMKNRSEREHIHIVEVEETEGGSCSASPSGLRTVSILV